MAQGWVRETLHFDRPVTVLFSTLVLPAVQRGFSAAAERHGIASGELDLRVVDGYVYTGWAPRPAHAAHPPPEDGPDLGEVAASWERERIPAIRAMHDEMRSLASPASQSRRVAGEMGRMQRLLERQFELHYDAGIVTQSGCSMLEGALARAGDPAPALTVATLLSPTDSLLRDLDAWLAEGAPRDDPRWLDAKERPSRLDLDAPTWGEAPHLMARGGDATAFREATRRAIERRDGAEAAMLARFPAEMADSLRAVLGMLRRARGAAQSINYLAGEASIGLARAACLRAGGRVLDEPGDVAHLTLDELKAALLGAPLPRGLVAQRRAAHALAARTVPPETIGEPAEELSTDPRLAALLGARARERGGALAGVGASPGRASGPARVVLHEDELDALRPGEVLVVVSLAPTWTSAMLKAAAIVTETGGLLSHAAVVAREMGRPAVVAVPGVTRRVRPGQKVSVDGETGSVVVDE